MEYFLTRNYRRIGKDRLTVPEQLSIINQFESTKVEPILEKLDEYTDKNPLYIFLKQYSALETE